MTITSAKSRFHMKLLDSKLFNEWRFERLFCLWCNPCQVSAVALEPSQKSTYCLGLLILTFVQSNRAVWQVFLFYFNCQSLMTFQNIVLIFQFVLTSNTTTVPSSHLTRAWESAQYAMWSQRYLRSISLSSFLKPMIWPESDVMVSGKHFPSRRTRLTMWVNKYAFLSSDRMCSD